MNAVKKKKKRFSCLLDVVSARGTRWYNRKINEDFDFFRQKKPYFMSVIFEYFIIVYKTNSFNYIVKNISERNDKTF